MSAWNGLKPRLSFLSVLSPVSLISWMAGTSSCGHRSCAPVRFVHRGDVSLATAGLQYWCCSAQAIAEMFRSGPYARTPRGLRLTTWAEKIGSSLAWIKRMSLNAIRNIVTSASVRLSSGIGTQIPEALPAIEKAVLHNP